MHLHFIGIGGTGMAGVALLLRELGHRVTGSDQDVYPPMSTALTQAGLRVLPFDPGNLSPSPDLVVLGAGVSLRNSEAAAAIGRNLPVTSFPGVIARFLLPGRDTICVAGTHGKTTTAAMLARLLDVAGQAPGFLIGGIPLDFAASVRLGRGAFVLEADEYKSSNIDRQPKFLKYDARSAIVTGIEFDHADHFADLSAVLDSYCSFAARLDPGGFLITTADETATAALREAAACRVVRVAEQGPADWRMSSDEHGFDLVQNTGSVRLGPVSLRVWGRHNRENAAAAAVAAWHMGVSSEHILRGLAGFSGVKRRLECIADTGGIRLYDDFAHHPTAVDAALCALREADASRRVWAIFEPKSASSRAPIFKEAYFQALAAADRVIVRDVQARWDGEPVLDVGSLVATLAASGTPTYAATAPGDILAMLAREVRRGDDLLVMSCGDFGGLLDLLRTHLARR